MSITDEQMSNITNLTKFKLLYNIIENINYA